jgi:hypothetical protein
MRLRKRPSITWSTAVRDIKTNLLGYESLATHVLRDRRHHPQCIAKRTRPIIEKID